MFVFVYLFMNTKFAFRNWLENYSMSILFLWKPYKNVCIYYMFMNYHEKQFAFVSGILFETSMKWSSFTIK